MHEPVEVRLWGRRIGAVVLPPGDGYASFQYDPAFVTSGIEVSPLTMPLATTVYRFAALAPQSFHGLPGMLADVLPDRFGNAVIDAWLARQQRPPESFDALDRLCYIGRRGMGALTFEPARGPGPTAAEPLDIAALRELAADVLRDREGLHAHLTAGDPDEATAAMRDILQVGTSAGGARAKALIAWNATTGEVRSGQLDVGPGFAHWLLKFDGVAHNRDKELADPLGFGAIEFAYHQMAARAGVEMSSCRLLEEGGRRHFMTRRFDRDADGRRVHMQTLAALAHLDFNQAGAHGYEQALLVARRLGLDVTAREQLVRRMIFNLVARNQDDHVKNIAFLMDRSGRWSLAPAYDVTWAYNPEGRWTGSHQMSVNGKRDGFTRADLDAVANGASLARGRASAILAEVVDAVSRWPAIAADVDVEPRFAATIAASHRLWWE